MKKTYCKNCRWYCKMGIDWGDYAQKGDDWCNSDAFWRIDKDPLILFEYQQKHNCPYYQCKWWKFWLT